MGISKRYTTKGRKNLLKNWRGPVMITEVHQEGRFYRLSTGRAAHYENNKPHNPSTEDWCNEVVQIDHQKKCKPDSGYNQVLVMIDHFKKYAEAVPCITPSAEETCDHLINTWIARHGCTMTFQSDNGTAFVGELTKELMRRSHVAQAHSTIYHPQTNGLVETQNRTLVSRLRVYCSRYMTDWDRHLPQVMGAYNGMQHSTTGVSPRMMLTGHEKSLPLTFF